MRNNDRTVEESSNLIKDEKRIFGKDITNQVKIIDKQKTSNGHFNNPIVHKERTITSLNGAKNLIKVVRSKNQSMDENILKKIMTNQNIFNFDNLPHIKSIPTFKENIDTGNSKLVNVSNSNSSNILGGLGGLFGVKTNSFCQTNNILKSNLQSNPIAYNNPKLIGINDALNTNCNFIKINSINKKEENVNVKYVNNNFTKNNNNIIIKTINSEYFEDSNIHMQTVSSEGENDTIYLESSLPCETYNKFPHLDYIDEIYSNLIEEESISFSFIDFIKYQSEINEKMRAVLVEWLIEVSLKFGLRQDTYFLTVSLIDQYLSNKIIKKVNLQLLGVSSLLIACKYEEIYFPEIRDFVYICDKAYTEKQILTMESEILITLKFNIFPIFPQRYLQIISHKLNLSSFDLNMCYLMLELFTFDYKVNKYRPSLIACTCLYITFKLKKFSNEESYEKIMKFLNLSSHTKNEVEIQIKECAHIICYLLDNINTPCFKKIKEKYSRKEFCEVAKFKIFN